MSGGPKVTMALNGSEVGGTGANLISASAGSMAVASGDMRALRGTGFRAQPAEPKPPNASRGMSRSLGSIPTHPAGSAAHPDRPLPIQWRNPSAGSFDDIGSAMKLLYVMSTVDDWQYLMFRLMDSTHPEHAPQRRDSSPSALFCISWMLIGSFFALNLFVGPPACTPSHRIASPYLTRSPSHPHPIDPSHPDRIPVPPRFHIPSHSTSHPVSAP